jgi:hypothetical protein
MKKYILFRDETDDKFQAYNAEHYWGYLALTAVDE